MNPQRPEVAERSQATIDEILETLRGTIKLSQFAEEVVTRSYDCVYDWVKKCGLPATKINGSYWIDPKLAARWWREHSTVLAKFPVKRRTRTTKAAKVA